MRCGRWYMIMSNGQIIESRFIQVNVKKQLCTLLVYKISPFLANEPTYSYILECRKARNHLLRGNVSNENSYTLDNGERAVENAVWFAVPLLVSAVLAAYTEGVSTGV